ncbi:integrase arm-type DNA-binding domain-containing protein [Burkholderia sola]|uniref:tyrosine-type recombinase/integrase n=1 Tax=Burkholderia TaxID=32008 RepID=UPI001AE2166E|nr:integrase arm-type DNA-binding domain-containing protein [Burkholderia sp. AcTa6-5]MBP0714221.1 tyrosine-type recombinase/integrase [Burkholderia sp. AcTa6-5]
MSLTAKQIEAAKPSNRDYILNDGDGLFLFVATSGTKSWHFRFTLAGKRARVSFGVFPTISLQRARELRAQAIIQVANGVHPKVRKSKANDSAEDADTFQAAAELWYKGKVDAGRAATTLNKFRTYLDKDILPELGRMRVSAITRADCARVQARIEKRDALNVSKKVRGWLREIFSQAIARGKCEYNPASELRVIAKEAPRARPYPHLLEPELPAFLQALERSTSRFIQRAAAWMTIWTASRPGMVRFAEWAEIDFDSACWTIPGPKMKMRRDIVIPLPTQLIDLLRELFKLTGQHRYLYPGIGWKNVVISENTINRVFSGIGYKGRMVGHGTRHTASTLLREHGWNKDHVEMQLAHVEEGTAGDYNQALYLPQRSAMMQWYADYVEALRQGLTAQQLEAFSRRVNVYKRHHEPRPVRKGPSAVSR